MQGASWGNLIDNEGNMVGAPVFAAWLMLASPHFELVTDASAKLGRSVLHDLERIREALAGPTGTPLPVRCFLFRNPNDFAQYRPTPITRAFFQSGPDRDYIAATLDTDVQELRRNLFHEYTHLFLNHKAALPKWADEGLAEYYSTMEFLSGKARVGAPIARHQATLAKPARLSADEMLAVASDSPEYTDEARAREFYAQAWAAAHVYASGASGRPLIVSESLGPAMLRMYLSKFPQSPNKLPVFDWPMDQSVEITDPGRTLTEAQAALLQMDLLLRVGKRDAAAQLFESLARRLPPSAVLESGLALIAVDRGDAAEAAHHFEQAIASPDAEADTFFEYAIFLENHNGSRGRIIELLAQVLARNPNHAEAQYLQGQQLVRAGNHIEAIAYFERASSILPRQELFLAALQNARQALQHNAVEKVGIRVPASWSNPVGDAKMGGMLSRVDCESDAARLHVESGGVTHTFRVRSEDRIRIEGATGAQIELTCGPQRPYQAVEIEFRSATGAVTAARFTAR